jgi:hypothetical protein
MKRKTLIKYGLTVVAASVALIGQDVAAQTQGENPNTATMTPDEGTRSAASAPTKEKQAAVTPSEGGPRDFAKN